MLQTRLYVYSICDEYFNVRGICHGTIYLSICSSNGLLVLLHSCLLNTVIMVKEIIAIIE